MNVENHFFDISEAYRLEANARFREGHYEWAEVAYRQYRKYKKLSEGFERAVGNVELLCLAAQEIVDIRRFYEPPHTDRYLP